MLNKKKLEMRRIEPLWSLSGIHAQIFLNIFNVIVEISSRLTLQISRLQFFSLDRQPTDGQNQRGAG